MNPDNMKVVLVIEQESKGIPYPADFEDGRTNAGFKDLKGNASELHTVVEANDCPALREALIRLNAPETPFFTVGCEKSLNPFEGKFWKKGYLEFSFNYVEFVADATHYFPLFFNFRQAEALKEFISKHQIQFCWEIQQCRFRKAEIGGFTCCVWVTTGDYPTASECEDVWDEAVRHLTASLAAVAPRRLPSSAPIYGI